MQIKIPVLWNPESHFTGAKEAHVAPESQRAAPAWGVEVNSKHIHALNVKLNTYTAGLRDIRTLISA